MTLSLRNITLGGGKNSLRETLNSLGEALSGYFARYRLALYLLSAAGVAVGLALNWNWLTAAGLFRVVAVLDRKSTRLNSSHTVISYAVFCLKKKKKQIN